MDEENIEEKKETTSTKSDWFDNPFAKLWENWDE